MNTPAAAAACAPQALTPESLRWRCRPEELPFSSTREVTPIVGVIGQETAVEALRFGLETAAPGQNIFVRGLTGTGRMTLLRRLLEEIRPNCPVALDRCYVHNFEQPDRPRLITLPRGHGRAFAREIDQLTHFIKNELAAALNGESIRARRNTLDQHAEKQVAQIVETFSEAARQAGLALVSVQAGAANQPALFPMVDGQPVTPEEFDQRRARGEVSEELYNRLREQHLAFGRQLEQVSEQIESIRRSHADAVRKLLSDAASGILDRHVRVIRESFPQRLVGQFLNEVINDIVSRLAGGAEGGGDFTPLYRVNVILEHHDDGPCPIVIENTPSMRKLLGGIDQEFGPQEHVRSSHMSIRAGSLLRADGGFLILDARDVLSEPGAWKVLVRTLRTGLLEIVPSELAFPWMAPSLKPEPLDVNIKVILMGDAEIYHMLDGYDPDFPHLFKILADFDTVIPRDAQGAAQYAGVLARIAQDESLPAFDRTAIAALVEHGARIASRNGKLTARFGRLADIAREAAYIATKDARNEVIGADVRDAVRRAKRRADLPSRHFREYLADGTIRIHTHGRHVGQVNGLAVLQAGPLTYGFPARITATIGAGTSGVINIEREAALSGAIHTKGFYILGGLLRALLRADHPLAFDASVAFEQSYGGIDGDSASGAEICCLLSALTDIPLRQDLAMTGAVDQAGNILAIGAVNEKIEGFYDTCRDLGLTGSQGVIIPKSNAGDLMLREDVVAACAGRQFHIYSVETVHEALCLFTDLPAGERGEDGRYPPGTLLARAVQRAREFFEKAAQIGDCAAPRDDESTEKKPAARSRAKRAK